MARGASVEGGLVFAHTRHGTALLKDWEGRARRTHAERVLGGDVDHLVCEFGDVAGADVVLPAVREGRVEHRLQVKEGHRPAEIEQGRSELPEWSDGRFAVLDGAGVTAADDHDELAPYFWWHSRQSGCRSVEDDCCQLV